MKTALIAGIILVTALSLNGLTPSWSNYLAVLYTATSSWHSQGIYGAVFSGRLVPTCGGIESTNLAEDIESHLPVRERVVVISPAGAIIDVPLNWTAELCGYFGTYRVGLEPGTYKVNLSCSGYPSRVWGCAFVVPINVTVRHDVFTKVDIHMYTGVE